MFKSTLFSLLTASAVFAGPHGAGVERDFKIAAANTTASTVDMVSATWFAGWHAATDITPSFGVNNVSWDKYTSVVYSFATTTGDDAHFALADSDAAILPDFVKAAHDNNVEARLALGGWGGSIYWSSAVGSAANRSASIKTLLKLVQQYDLDGFDIDWEYPGSIGIGCNEWSPDDSKNLLSFLQELRSEPSGVGAKLIVTAAVVKPFSDASGNPGTDVSAFADVLDYVEIMNYDIHGNWSAPNMGPNAPLNDTCLSSSNAAQAQGSAVSFVQEWVQAGFPAYKLVLGLASYGHTFFIPSGEITTASQLADYPNFSASQSQGPSLGDTWTNTGGLDQCGNFTAAGGDMDFWGLVYNGFLSQNGTALPGIDHTFDDCSQTDYVFNPATNVAVSYDSPRAFAAKGDFIVQSGLRGFSIWEAGGDYNDILLDSVRKATGWQETDGGCDGSD